MSTPLDIEKIDMSLDDIIKMNKKVKQQSRGGKNSRGQSSNRGQRQNRGRGSNRSRGGRQNRGNRNASPNKYKQLRTNIKGAGRGGQRSTRGAMTRGIINKRGNQKGISPLNRTSASATSSERGQPRGRGGLNRGRGLGRQNLQERRSQALKALQQAKQTLAKINAQQWSSKQNRQNIVNQRRGIQSQKQNLSSGRGRGRGGRGRGRGGQSRGRGGGLLNRSQSLQSLGSLGQGGRGFGSTMSLNSQTSSKSYRRRTWRGSGGNLNSQNQNILTVQVTNPQPRRPTKIKRRQRQNSLREEILNLKPDKKEKFQVQKIFFAQSNTGVPLSERFGGSSGVNSGGRKVFF